MPKRECNCPADETLAVIAGRWKVPILWELFRGKRRFSELRRLLGDACGQKVLTQQLHDVRGRHVLLVDDILDTGGTLAAAVPLLHEMGADSVRTCVLLKKRLAAAPKIDADYVGFEIPDEFVVGYGLDFNNLYRNLPDIVVLRPDVIDAGHPDGQPER